MATASTFTIAAERERFRFNPRWPEIEGLLQRWSPGQLADLALSEGQLGAYWHALYRAEIAHRPCWFCRLRAWARRAWARHRDAEMC